MHFFDSFGLVTKTYLCFFDSFGLHYNLSLVTKTTETGVGTQAAACSETKTQCESSSIMYMILMYLYQPCSSLLMHTCIEKKRLNTDLVCLVKWSSILTSGGSGGLGGGIVCMVSIGVHLQSSVNSLCVHLVGVVFSVSVWK